ncbi:hypothetical protein CO669_21925 [Bradyrhizobium sp. Y36]|uniref:S8 family serine peptidase n=1 Tax=Bradyrhizobium sp. Y36 TaxID=2035447 RepID=UPI000BE93ED4|nr:S8 family serine peptidase [Bradyrhizobium sp. Y36]PDT88281.1 hypothetical protein CO669_21925 [Bradyrhizobium sp. Y36]
MAKQRFVVSQLISKYAAGQRRTDALEMFSARLDRVLMPAVNIVSDTEGGTKGQTERRVVVFEADPVEVQSKGAELTADTIIEPELLRVPAVYYPAGLSLAAAEIEGPSLGTGATLDLFLQGARGDPVASAEVVVRFNSTQGAATSLLGGGFSSAAGKVSLPFDPNQWRPNLAVAQPVGQYWTAILQMPQSGQAFQLQDLPQNGPSGWWHYLSGLSSFRADAGKGIKVGVIDSGVGPHPNLQHAVPIGSFLDGNFVAGAALDARNHGTHVSGIIGARPPQGSGEFSGIAPGADLYVARIFTKDGGGNQGDVANAIDVLSQQHGADIINMSITGAPSSIEHDAVIAAFDRGTVCVCAAGNQNGSPVGYPAAYPQSVAVSALGMPNAAPVTSLPALNAPTQPDRSGFGGLFLASFSNIGQIYCAAPGNGIVSTIPTNALYPGPYADMSGTSMASPLVAGVLANLLEGDQIYRRMERNVQRAIYAKTVLGRHALGIGLSSTYQGYGLARMV